MKFAFGQPHYLPRFAVLGLVLLTLAGCSGRPKNIARKVTGKVTLGGQPLAGATIIFTPLEGGSPSTGKTDASGSYSLVWARYKGRAIEGAQIGEHAVKITTETAPVPSAKPPIAAAPEKVPFKYRGQEPLKATVKSGSNAIDFTLEPGPINPPQPKGKKGKK